MLWTIKSQHYRYLERLYEDVFGGLHPRKISHEDRIALGLKDLSYVYGESNFAAFAEILKVVQPRKGLVFYDLGSGAGKAVIAAALLGNFSLIRGIEKLPNLHAIAETAWKRLQSNPRVGELDLPKVDLILGDLHTVPFADGDVIYMCSTCYDEALMSYLSLQMLQLKPGTWVIMVENECGEEAELTTVATLKLNMEWGKIHVTIARRNTINHKLPSLEHDKSREFA